MPFVSSALDNFECLDIINVFNEVISIAGSTNADIITYVVPPDKDFYLLRSAVSGDNYAYYFVTIDGISIDKIRTSRDNFDIERNYDGVKVLSGSIIKVVVENYRNSASDFNARITGSLI